MHSTFALSPEQITRFEEQGFLAIPGLASPAEIEHVRTIYDSLFAEKSGYERGLHLDMLSPEDAPSSAPRLTQILNPTELAGELLVTHFRKNALSVARQLLGDDAEPWFEHAICKPARHGAETPWHQDEAHRNDPGVTYRQLSIWMPLQEATMENGCMRYITGSHRGPVLRHRSPNNDPRIMALECADPFDTALETFVPLGAGDAVAHDARTLHGANANRTDSPRRAYIMAFRGATRPDAEFRGYPWNLEKRTPANARAAAWKERGGPLGRTARAIGGALGRFAERVRRKAGKIFRGTDS